MANEVTDRMVRSLEGPDSRCADRGLFFSPGTIGEDTPPIALWRHSSTPCSKVDSKSQKIVTIMQASKVFVLALVCFLVPAALGQSVISTFAGVGLTLRGTGGPATQATLFTPAGVVVGPSGNVYISDELLGVVLKVTPSGIVSVFAGIPGTQGFSGDAGAATSAELYQPTALAVDSSENVYIASSSVVREVTAAGVISTVAGAVDVNSFPCGANYLGDGGPATSACVSPFGLALQGGNLYISDGHFNRVRMVTLATGIITTVAGSGLQGGSGGFSGDGGQATSAQLDSPAGLAFDAQGNLYIADQSNNRIRQVNTNGIISTFAGDGQQASQAPLGDGGPATAAAITFPSGVAVDGAGNLYISGIDNRIRKVALSGIISTYAGTGAPGFAGDGGPATQAQMTINQGNPGLAINPAGDVYICDNSRVRVIDAAGTINTFAGNGESNSFGDGGPAVSAGLETPVGVAADGNGNVFIAEQATNDVRKVASSGIITTYAGTGVAGYSGDGGQAADATLNLPVALATDSAGNLYVVDQGNQVVRKITPAGVITTFAGNGEYGYSGDGSLATNAELASPSGLAVAANGTIYIADRDNERIRAVTPNGIINTVAGSGAPLAGGFSGDGGPATNAQLNAPQGVTVDGNGNLYIADTSNWRIRKVDSSGIITTVAGMGPEQGAPISQMESSPLAAWVESPGVILADASGNVYFNSDMTLVRLGSSGVLNEWIPGYGYSGDGGPAALGQIWGAEGLAFDYNSTLYIADTQNDRIRMIVPGDASPAFSVSTSQLTFSVVSSGSPAAQILTIDNSGGGFMSWTASSNEPWLTLSDSSGILPGAANITVTANSTNLAAGMYSGEITLSSPSTASSTTVAVNLTVVEPEPGVTLSPASLTFAPQNSGSTSAAQTVTLANRGTAALSITSITASPNFAESNNCGSSVAAGASCTISVTFAPVAGGSLTGTLTVADNASGSPQTVALTGTGSTVTLVSSSNSLNISSPGGSASAVMQLSAAGGFSGSVNVACSVTYQSTGTVTDAPTCSLNPTQQQVSGTSSASTTLTVDTTSSNSAQVERRTLLPLGGGAVAGLILFLGVPRRRWRGRGLLVLSLFMITGTCVGCRGVGTTTTSGGNQQNSGTTAGSYQVTVTATSGTVTASLSIPLTVQ